MFDALPDQHWDQIPFKQNLVPYNDLQAQGGYNRQLIVPDDIFLTLAVGTALQGDIPRIWTMDDDGGINVHVTNQSGGGGGTFNSATYTPFSGGISGASIDVGWNNLAGPFALSQYLFAATVSLFIPLSSWGAFNEGHMDMAITNASGGGAIFIYHAQFNKSTTDAPASQSVFTEHIVFEPALDVMGTFGTNVEIWIDNQTGVLGGAAFYPMGR